MTELSVKVYVFKKNKELKTEHWGMSVRKEEKENKKKVNTMNLGVRCESRVWSENLILFSRFM